MDKIKVTKLFSYADGKLYWLNSRKGVHDITKEAGGVSDGRRNIMVDGKMYKTHRLVFLYHHGYLPEVIDHIDCNPLNNHIDNLREATVQLNNYNRSLDRNNTSGVKGVSWNTRSKKWVVQVGVNKTRVEVGRFVDLELAELVAREFRDKYHGDFARHL
jgi:hypothetical protein